jgi:radical SAM superfamily enzyme YgiQ (UPF0313 family)
MSKTRLTVAFVVPCVGRKASGAYPRSWLMEPLAAAVLSSRTPPSFGRVLYDDRLEDIPYEAPVDAAALSVETYTARRACQIAAEFRRRGVPVIMGGFHPSLAPDDMASHADAIVIGEAEELWPRVLEDLQRGRLQARYRAERRPNLGGLLPDRSIFSGKRYMNLALVETGRGCRFACEFCSVSAFFQREYVPRPVEDVVREIRGLARRNVFFVDDNLAVDRARTLELFRAIEPCGIRWAGQISVHAARDEELLEAAHRSGCMGVLVGFESLQPGSRAVAEKGIPGEPERCYDAAMVSFARHRIAVYGTFVFGDESDTADAISRATNFASRHNLFFAAFNHLVPFPGTPLYRRLRDEKRFVREKWWMAPDYRFGDVAFRPANMSPEGLADACLQARRAFYAWPRILRRALNLRSNSRSPFMAATFLMANVMSRREVDQRQGLPLGMEG